MLSKMNDLLLVPTDFSEVCDKAIKHALEMAKFLNFKVVLLHVINKETKSVLKKENQSDDYIATKLAELARNYNSTSGVTVDSIAREGSIFSTISEVAEELGANFIILGTHGKVGIQQHLLGSYALKVVTSSKCPIIIVQNEQFENGYKNVVFPIDLSSEARQKLTWAVYLGQKFKSTIHLLPHFESEPNRKNKIMSITKQIKNILAKNGVDFVDKVSDPKGGNYATQVIDYAKKNEADLIMIMTEEEKLVNIPSFILGPWDEQIIYNNSEIPVLCVNPRDLGIIILGL